MKDLGFLMHGPFAGHQPTRLMAEAPKELKDSNDGALGLKYKKNEFWHVEPQYLGTWTRS